MTGSDLGALRRLVGDGNEEAADRLAELAAERLSQPFRDTK